ncbi:MAG: helicase HerA-like domain-containing protein, partial [Solirubrobacteraceae bacterium]
MRPPLPGRSRGALVWAGLAIFAVMAVPAPLGTALLTAAIAARAAVWTLARVRQARARRVAAVHTAGTRLGTDASGNPVLIPDEALAAHGLVLGATGAGKSTTLLSVLTQQVERGLPVVVIDLKGSPNFAATLRAAALTAGRPFAQWTPDGGASWNPLAHGNATELKDKLIATERFTEPHYKRAAERYVQLAIGVMQERRPDRPVTLAGVVELLQPQRLAAATRSLPRERGEYVRSYIESLTPDQVSAIRGLQTRLAIIAESHTGRHLEPPAPGEPVPTIDLRESLRGPQVVLFSLNSSTYGGLAAQLGTLVVQDLVTAAGARLTEAGTRTSAPQAFVGIDEFSALGSENVMALLARGREAGVAVLLATQELADLDRAGHGLRQQVLGNTAVKIAHRQDVPASATLIAEIAGKIKAWDLTHHGSSNSLGVRGQSSTTARLVDRFNVEPEQVRTMRAGEALVILKSPTSSARITRILPPPKRDLE